MPALFLSWIFPSKPKEKARLISELLRLFNDPAKLKTGF